MKKLNAAQEKFARLIFETVPPSEAYKQCWKADSMSDNAIAVEANRRTNHDGIAARIAELKSGAADKSQVTVESLLAEFEEARQMAKTEAQPAAMVSASMGKAKITGLDKKVIEIQDKEELTPWSDIETD